MATTEKSCVIVERYSLVITDRNDDRFDGLPNIFVEYKKTENPAS
jgi:hypothetical protein